MSQWTQISGSIRIDSSITLSETHNFDDKKLEKNLKNALGVVVDYESPNEVWESENRTPTGSEGGIKYEFVSTTNNDSSICRGAIIITGSLRDFGLEEYPQIKDWLNKAFSDPQNRNGYYVRQGAVEVEISGIKTMLLVWDDKADLFKEIEIPTD